MNHVKKYSPPSFWQSETWRDILISSRQAIFVDVLPYEEGRYLYEIRSIGLGQVAVFCLGISPESLSDGLIEALIQVTRSYNPLYLQVECLPGETRFFPIRTCHYPYKQFIEPYTRIIDLNLSEAEILSQMHEKGRYNIRLAEKRGIQIEAVESTPENIDIWMNILHDTTDRDGFSHNSRDYYQSFLADTDSVQLSFARYDDRVIAAGIWVYMLDTATYYYGASVSDREMRKHMAPYLLQWHAISEAKRRGMRYYDFLGVAPPDDVHSHLAGVSSFKEKFGGSIIELGPKYLFPLSWKYRVFSLIRKIKNRGK